MKLSLLALALILTATLAFSGCAHSDENTRITGVSLSSSPE